MAAVIVSALGEAEVTVAARMAAAAFAADPYWLALGPRHPGLRRRLIRHDTARELRRARRAGETLLAIRAAPSELSGLARVAEEVRHGPPGRPPPAILACGPIAVKRWRDFETRLADRIPAVPHDYLYTLAVAPHRQGSGLGRRLLGAVIERARERERRLILDTMTWDNVLWYRRAGLVEIDDLPLPRGHHAWVMEWCGDPAS